MVRTKTVLPAPDSPTMLIDSPGCTLRSTPLSTATAPDSFSNETLTSSMASNGSTGHLLLTGSM